MEEKIMDLTPEVIDVVTTTTTDAVGDTSSGVDLKTAGLVGLAAIVLGAGAYFGYKKYQEHKNKK
jgi:hypothetical protein